MGGHDREKRASYKRFIGFPKDVVDHPNFRMLTPNGMKLLMAIKAQYDGSNNGDLTCTWSDMHTRWNFRSKETWQNGLQELHHYRFISRTVQGRRIAGVPTPSLYAVTWEPLNDRGKGYAGTTVPSHAWKQDYGPWRRKLRPKK